MTAWDVKDAWGRWQAERAARARLGALDAGVPIRIQSSLARGEKADVFRITMGDGSAVAKIGHGPKAAERLVGEAQILAERARRLGDGPARVPQVLHRFPEASVLILEEIRADSLGRHLAQRPGDRAALVARAAGWCAAYSRGERVSDDFGGRFWLRLREAEATGLTAARPRQVAEALVTRMREARADIANRPVTRARSHGNLTPANLLIGEDVVWGVGVEHGQWIALVKDIARLLVQLSALHGSDGAGPAGLDGGDTGAFAEAGVLYPGEIETMLPFFAASELVGALARAPDRTRARALATLGERMLDAGAAVI